MTHQPKDTIARLDKLILRAERSLQIGLFKAIRNARSQQSLAELANLIEQGRFHEASEAAGQAIGLVLAGAYGAAYVLAGNSTAEFIADSTGGLATFNPVSNAAVAHVQNERLRILTAFGGQQSDAVRAVIVDGMNRRLSSVEIARNFRGSIGMTEKMVQTVANYRKLLETGSREALNRVLRDRRSDPKIRAAITGGKQLSRQSIDMMVRRYGERLIKRRAETIAQTEVLRAVNKANQEAFEQAIESGVLEREQLVRKWVTKGDTDVRKSHVDLNGQERAVDEDFKPNLRFPGDPRAPLSEIINCRCRIETRIKQKSTARLIITERFEPDDAL